MSEENKNKSQTSKKLYPEYIGGFFIILAIICIAIFTANTYIAFKSEGFLKDSANYLKIGFIALCIVTFSICLTIIICKCISITLKARRIEKIDKDTEILLQAYKEIFRPVKNVYNVEIDDGASVKNIKITLESNKNEKSEN